MDQNQLFDAAAAQDVREFFENVIQEAKKYLLAEGKVVHVCWLFCPTASVIAHRDEFRIDASAPLNKTVDETPRSIITVHLSATTKELLDMAGKLYPEMSAGTRLLVDVLQNIGGLKQDDALQRVLKSLLGRLQINEGTLVLEYMHFLIKRLDAFAYILQAEGLMLNFDLADPKDLEKAKAIAPEDFNRPDAQKALLIQMENSIEQRLVSIPFKREEGKPTALGEPIEIKNYQGGFNAGLKNQVMN